MTRLPFRIRPFLAPLGGALIYLGERAFVATPGQPLLDVVGAGLLVVSLAWALWRPWRPEESPPPAARWLVAFSSALFVLAALLYFLTLLVPEGPAVFPDWGALLGWGWMLALLLGVFPHGFVELALSAQGGTHAPEVQRLQRAVGAGLGLGLLLALIVTLNFIFTRLPWQWDLAYFKTAAASTATSDVVRGLQEPVDVALFFPDGHAALPQLEAYFRGLPEGKLNMQKIDADLQPAVATAFKARGNGVVVVRRGEFTQDIQVGLPIARARKALRTFDRSFFKVLLEVSSDRRTAYLTVGHGERNERAPSRGDIRYGVSSLKKLLEERNYQVKPYGAADGLDREVPKDAALLIAFAPREPFLPGETDAVKRYLEDGGKLLLFLDPDTYEVPRPRRGQPPAGLQGLLAGYGMEFIPILQANERYFARRTFTKSDHILLVTNGYQSHPSVSTLRKDASQNPLLLLGAGEWKRGKPPRHLRLKEVIKGMPGTWGDKNGNFEFDRGRERQGSPILALALNPPSSGKKNAPIVGKGPHIMAFADADLATDFLMRNKANQLLLAETIAWLSDREKPSGLPSVEADVQLRHVKEDELVWFYLPVFGVPLLVLALGFLLAGRPVFWRRS